MKNFLLFLFLIGFIESVNTQILDVLITNIQNYKGVLCIGIFANEEEFISEKPSWKMKVQKINVVNGEFRLKIPIQAGKYGLSVLDDENGNEKMDYKLHLIPCEGFGFSDFFHKGIKQPHFSDFSFYIEKNETKVLVVKMKYI